MIDLGFEGEWEQQRLFLVKILLTHGHLPLFCGFRNAFGSNHNLKIM